MNQDNNSTPEFQNGFPASSSDTGKSAGTMPELVLNPDEAAAVPVKLAVDLSDVLDVKPFSIDYGGLNEAEKSMVKDFSKKIDIRDSNQVLQYGNGAQKKISSFSESTLANVRTKDMDEIGEMITSLVTELKGFSEDDEPKGIRGFFKKPARQIQMMQTRYESMEKNVDRICDNLENHKIQLLRDIAMLDKMYEMNLDYFKELSMYVLAGRERLNQALEQELPAMRRKAQESGRSEDAQEARDFASMCTRFDKKLHDLELTRTISLQMGPQIRLVQNNNSIMVEKIQSSISNSIPLWKNQMVLSLGLAHSQSALKAQREVTDVTNQLLRKNADILKTGTVEVARESERGIVDIETLRYTNESLISTLDEVLQIQEEGRTKRREAEAELGRIEAQLKNKLLEISDPNKG